MGGDRLRPAPAWTYVSLDFAGGEWESLRVLSGGESLSHSCNEKVSDIGHHINPGGEGSGLDLGQGGQHGGMASPCKCQP